MPDILERARKYREDYGRFASGYRIVGEMIAEIEGLRRYPAAIEQLRKVQFTDQRICDDIEQMVREAAESDEQKRLDFLDGPDDRLIDGQGMAFADYRALLPERAADFPPAQVVKDPGLLKRFREGFDCCQICGVRTEPGVWLQLHHIMHGFGGAGRSEMRTNLIMACWRPDGHGCHDKIHASETTLANVLYAKWATDREGTSWVRLAVLRGSHLPKPKPLSKQEKDHASRDL